MLAHSGAVQQIKEAFQPDDLLFHYALDYLSLRICDQSVFDPDERGATVADSYRHREPLFSMLVEGDNRLLLRCCLWWQHSYITIITINITQISRFTAYIGIQEGKLNQGGLELEGWAKKKTIKLNRVSDFISEKKGKSFEIKEKLRDNQHANWNMLNEG